MARILRKGDIAITSNGRTLLELAYFKVSEIAPHIFLQGNFRRPTKVLLASDSHIPELQKHLEMINYHRNVTFNVTNFSFWQKGSSDDDFRPICPKIAHTYPTPHD